jgi:hypothetical protein
MRRIINHLLRFAHNKDECFIRSTNLNTEIARKERQWYLLAASSCDLEDRNAGPPILFMCLTERKGYMNLMVEQRTNYTFLASNVIDRYWARKLRNMPILALCNRPHLSMLSSYPVHVIKLNEKAI